MTKFNIFTLVAIAFVVTLAVFGVIPPEAVAAIPVVAFGTVFTENARVGDWLKWEEDQRYSREAITVLSGQNLKSGAVMGRQLVGATAAATAFAANTGNGVMGAITVTSDARRGIYKLIVIEPGTNVGTFEVEDPDGKVMGRGAVATAFSAGGLAFTLADGATDFVAGDGFNIEVVGGTFKYLEHDPAGTDGSEKPHAILFMDCNATAADTAAVAIVRKAIVASGSLVWKTAMTADQKAAALLTLEKAGGIVARTQV